MHHRNFHNPIIFVAVGSLDDTQNVVLNRQLEEAGFNPINVHAARGGDDVPTIAINLPGNNNVIEHIDTARGIAHEHGIDQVLYVDPWNSATEYQTGTRDSQTAGRFIEVDEEVALRDGNYVLLGDRYHQAA